MASKTCKIEVLYRKWNDGEIICLCGNDFTLTFSMVFGLSDLKNNSSVQIRFRNAWAAEMLMKFVLVGCTI